MNNKFKLLILFLSFLFIVSGCVGKRELNDLAMVLAVGIDKGEKKDIRITIQVPRPSDARGQTGAPAGNTGDPIWAGYGEGNTIFEAIRDLSRFSTRGVFWAHNYVIVISEEVAKEGISDIIDFFTRNSELRMQTWVAITPDKASEIVSTTSGLEITTGESIDSLFRYSRFTSKSPQTQMIDLQSAYLSETREPILGRVKLIDKGVSNKKPGEAKPVKQIELAGTGVFKGDQLVGVLNDRETMGLMPFFQKVESGEITLPCSKGEENISGEIRNKQLKITPSVIGNKPKFDIKMDVDLRIVEAGCPFSMNNQSQVNKLQKQIEEIYKQEIKSLLKIIQEEYKSDIIGFEDIFRSKFPAEWKEINQRWEEEFQQASMNVSVSAKIVEAALLFEPTKTKQENQ